MRCMPVTNTGCTGLGGAALAHTGLCMPTRCMPTRCTPMRCHRITICVRNTPHANSPSPEFALEIAPSIHSGRLRSSTALATSHSQLRGQHHGQVKRQRANIVIDAEMSESAFFFLPDAFADGSLSTATLGARTGTTRGLNGIMKRLNGTYAQLLSQWNPYAGHLTWL
jgi:hypothetical protein